MRVAPVGEKFTCNVRKVIMKEKVQVGVIGLDNWYHAFPYIEAVVRSRKAELKAVSDWNREKLAYVRNKYGLKELHTQPEKILTDPSIEAVIVTAATGDHADIAISAAENGKHIVCDKPLEVSIDRAISIKKAVEQKGVTFAMSFPRRARRLYREARKTILEGVIGDPLCIIETGRYSLPSENPWVGKPGWYTNKKKAGGGGFLDHSVHQIDMLRWLISSEATSVMCRLDNLIYKDLEVDDYGVATLAFQNNAIGTIESSWISSGRSIDVIDIQGTLGSLRVDVSSRNLEIVVDHSGERTSRTYAPKSYLSITETMRMPMDGFEELFRDFLNALMTGERPLATVEDGCAVVEVSSAANRSAQTGSVVNISRNGQEALT
jgi:predicted dehydrogenase